MTDLFIINITALTCRCCMALASHFGIPMQTIVLNCCLTAWLARTFVLC